MQSSPVFLQKKLLPEVQEPLARAIPFLGAAAGISGSCRTAAGLLKNEGNIVAPNVWKSSHSVFKSPPWQDGGRRRRRPCEAILRLELLEDRTLPSITLTGVPTWIPQGPGPTFKGQTEGLTNNPVSGAVKAIAADPDNANRVFIGTVNGGIWKTDNATAASPNWTPLTDLYPSLSISSIAFDPLDASHNTLFAGIGEFSSDIGVGGPTLGVLRTTDGGAHWSILGQSAFGTETVTKVVPTALSQGGHEVVVVATSVNGIYRSADDGNTFTLISGSDLPSSEVTDLIADPRSSSGLFAALPNVGIYHSTDGGLHWMESDTGVTGLIGADNIKLAAMSGPTSTIVYAAVDHFGQLSGVFRSANGAGSWSPMDLPGTTENVKGVPTFFGIHPGKQGDIHLSLAADPTNPNIVYIGGDRQPGGGNKEPTFPNASGANDFSGRHFIGNASQPAGSQWSAMEDNGANGTAPHADSRALVFDAFGNLLDGDDGGIYRLSNPAGSSRTWASAIGDLTATEFVSMAFDPLNNIIFGGAQDTGSPEQGTAGTFGSWNEINEGDGGVAASDSVVAGGGPGQTIRYTTSQFLGLGASFHRRTFDNSNDLVSDTNLAKNGLVVTGSGGQTIYQYDQSNGFSNLEFVNPYVTNSVAFGRLLIGTSDKVFESTDEGDTVADVGTLGLVSALAYGGTSAGVANPDVAYVGANGGLYMRILAGHSFDKLTAYSGSTVKAIVLDPTDWHIAYVIDPTHVFKTMDAGATWEDLTGDLAKQTSDFKSLLLFQDGQNFALLVGAQGGLYRTLNDFGSNTTWTQFGANLPNTGVESIHYDAGSDSLIVATHGRGVWRLNGATFPLERAGFLQITGDSNPANKDDAIRLAIDPFNPLLLDVFVNNPGTVPDFQVKFAAIQQIDVQAGAGVNTLILDGSGDPTGRAVSINPDAVSGVLPVLVTFNAGELTNLTIKGGTGNDSFILQDKPPILNVTLDGGGGGNALSGSPIDTTWNVTGANAGTMNGVTFKSFGTLVGDFMADTFKFGAAGSVSGIIDGGGGANTFDYSGNGGLAATVNLAKNSATSVHGNASNGWFDIQRFVGSTSTGDALVGSNAATTWNITGANSGNLTGGFSFAGVENLFGGSAEDTFKFGAGSSVAGSVNGGPGVNPLDYSGDGGVVATMNLQSHSASRIRSGVAGGFTGIHRFIGSSSAADNLVGANTVNNWRITGANAGDVNGFLFSGVENVFGGSLNDSFIFGPAGNLIGKADGRGGTNRLDYSANGGTAITVNLQTSAAPRLMGGNPGGFVNMELLIGSSSTGDTLIGPNADSLWQITGPSAGQVGAFAFQAIEHLMGGTGVDTFKLSPAGRITSIRGGGNRGDWLDYSLFPATTPVSVNLATGSATDVNGGAAGGALGIQNAVGGAGNDTLIGNALGSILVGGGGNDTITAGSGRSLLIGGLGTDTITGGSADDLLISGTTSFDSNQAALMAILNEWQRTDKNYAQRITDLRTGAGLSGGNKLVLGTTVFNDTSADVLKGNGGLDWFFANLGPAGIKDTIQDRNTGGAEQVN
jgi:hypothetical protein